MDENLGQERRIRSKGFGLRILGAYVERITRRSPRTWPARVLRNRFRPPWAEPASSEASARFAITYHRLGRSKRSLRSEEG